MLSMVIFGCKKTPTTLSTLQMYPEADNVLYYQQLYLVAVSICLYCYPGAAGCCQQFCLTPFSVIHMYLVAKVILYYLVLADCKKYPVLLSMSIWLKERISFMLLTVVSDCKRYPPLLFMCIRLQRKKKRISGCKKKKKKKKQRKDSCYHKYTKG